MAESNGTDIHGLGTTKDTNQHERGQAQGYAWTSQAGAEFSNPFPSELAGIVKTHRFLALRAALLCRALREINNCQELASRKNTGQAWLAGMAVFLKRHLQA